MIDEYKGIINKSIINSYSEVLVIDIMDDKLYKYLIKDSTIVNDKVLSYMQYLNDCNELIYEDDIDDYVEALSISRLENEQQPISLVYKMKDDQTGSYCEYISDINLYENNGKRLQSW